MHLSMNSELEFVSTFATEIGPHIFWHNLLRF